MSIESTKTPFQKMSFTPDVPSGSLSANEYNSGLNVETDTRGIKKILGEVDILSQIPGQPIFVTGNFRNNSIWWFVVATADGNWWGLDSAGITSFTPQATTYINDQYDTNTKITATWNGNVLFINDTINPPMYLLPNSNEIRLYDYAYNDQTPNTYVWNYYADQGYTNFTAKFLRLYSSPTIGSILVAGDFSYVLSGTVYNEPNTIRWSQNFGLNAGPTTWAPTLTNIANEVPVPVRGPLIDGFPLNGNFYMFSYWDCVMMMPLSYQSTTAPVFGISLVTQGRGLLNENCFAINDTVAFGVDSSDIWMLNNGTFTEIGNQRVKNWFYGNLHPSYTNQVFAANNTFKNQYEIYYPDLTSTGLCNKMLAYRYDLDVWNPPRDVNQAVMALEAPVFDPNTNQPNIANRGVVYASGASTYLIQKDVGNGFFNGGPTQNINAYFRRDNINFGEPYSNLVEVHRVLPEVYGTGTVTIQVGGADSVGQTPTFRTTATMAITTSNPWIQTIQNTQRVSSVILGSNDSTGTWIVPQINWQVSVTEDTR